MTRYGGFVHGAYPLHHPAEVIGAEVRPGRETNPVAEEALRNLPSDRLTPRDAGLQLHGLPYRARFDVLRFQSLPDRLTVGTERLRVNREARQPAGRPAPGCLGHELDSREVLERIPVELEVPAAG